MKRSITTTTFIVLLLAILVIVLTPLRDKVIATLHLQTPHTVQNPSGRPLPTINSPVAYLLDADTNDMLLSIGGTKRLPMASTTKIMTTIIALEKGNPDQMITVKQDAIEEAIQNQGSNAGLTIGEEIPLNQMLYGLMLPSGDDAAIAIADSMSGSPANFVKIMNQYAQKLHLNDTHYINPDGLTYYDGPNKSADPNEYTTAADLAKLTRYALQNPTFAHIVQTQQFVLDATADHGEHTWTNTDNLLSEYPDAIGVKTGFTVEAGYCLVFAAKHANHTLIGVVLQGKGENDRFIDAPTLLNWGFGLATAKPTIVIPQN